MGDRHCVDCLCSVKNNRPNTVTNCAHAVSSAASHENEDEHDDAPADVIASVSAEVTADSNE